jgi:hypothetical protein
MVDLTKPNTILYFEQHDPAVVKDEMEKEMMKQCQEQSSSESQDWNSHLVCDNGVIDGMRLCAVQKVDPPDDVGLEWAMTLGEVDGWLAPAHRGWALGGVLPNHRHAVGTF